MPTYDHGVSGLTGTIGVTVRNADGTSHDARTTTGITEPVAGSGVYHIAHPHPGTLLLFIFDGGVGTVGASVWDDGLTTMPARAGDAMTLTAAYDAAKTAAQASTALSNATWSDAKAGYLDAAVSSRSTYAGADTAGTTTLLSRLSATRAGYLDALSTGVPVGSASVTAIAEAVRDLATSGLAALKALIDAIKAKTDNIPATPAAVGDAMTLTAAYDAAKTAAAAGAKMDLVDAPNATALTAIKAKLEEAGSTLATLLSRIVGTLLTGNHSPQSGDGYAVVNSGTHGNSALKTLIDAKASQTSVNAIPTTPLLAGDYTAPDNAGIAAAQAAAEAAQAAAEAIPAAPSAADIKTAMEAAGGHLALILEDTGTTLPATLAGISEDIQSVVSVEFGLDTCTLTFTDASGDAIADASVYLSDTNPAVLRTKVKTTDSLGQVQFNLMHGTTYYGWLTSDSFTGTNPFTFVASRDT